MQACITNSGYYFKGILFSTSNNIQIGKNKYPANSKCKNLNIKALWLLILRLAPMDRG